VAAGTSTVRHCFSSATRALDIALLAREASGPMRTASSAGSPTTIFDSRAAALRHRIDLLARHDGAADGGAFLAGLGGHLAPLP
jgi:hypothetical protein